MSVPFPPISDDELASLHELGAAEQNMREQLYELEMAKIPILAAGDRIRKAQGAVYRRIATARGLAPDTLLNVNMKTGEVRLVEESALSTPSPDLVETPE